MKIRIILICANKFSLYSDLFGFDVWSTCFLHLSIVFIVEPSLVDVIADTSAVLPHHFYYMGAGHSRAEVVFALATPALALQVVHQIEPILSLVFRVRDVPNQRRFPFFQSKRSRLLIILTNLFKSQMLQIL